MIAMVKKASVAALVCVATAAQATEGELWFRKAEKVALARGIQDNGFACVEIKAVYFLGGRSDGNDMRAVCGTEGESEASSNFRLTVRGSGTYRVEPWSERGNVFAEIAALRAALD